MALNTNPFVEGIDPTSTFGGYASVLLQLIRQAIPSSTYGMILFDTTAPDVTGSNAWRKTCLWLSLANPAEPALYVYKTSSPGWVNINDIISPNSITTAMIQNNAVTLAKLSVAGGAANQLIRVNAGVTGFEFVSLSSLVTAGSIPVGSLITTGIPGGQFRLAGTYGPGVANWYTAQNVIDNLPTGYIPTDLIAPAPGATTRSKFLTTRTPDTFGTWRFFEPNVDILNDTLSGGKLQNGTVAPIKIESAGIPDGYLLSKVGGVPDWIPAPTANYVNKYASTATALPAAGNAITPLNHGLGGQPINVYGVLVCVTPEHGYVANDEVPLCQIYRGATDNEFPVWYFHATTTQIHCVRSNAGATMITAHATTGNATNLNDARWNIKFYAIK
jgi:hypothetical protein